MTISISSGKRTGNGGGGGIMPQVNPHWARLPLFNRKNWSRVRFGDVVRMLKEQTDPVADGVERYVAGEHMETENVHIHKWGNVGDGYLGPAFIRWFRKGQVLYGSRRTYLKKVAVAEWDGVTANTTFVLEAVEGKLMPELLPWLMLSERFTRHSVRESKGSTNPYINFPDIAKFEFDLPPLDQQRLIAEILWAVDETKQAFKKSAQAAAVVRRTKMQDAFSNKEYPTLTIRESGDVQLGRQRAPKYQSGAFTKPYLRVANVFDGFMDYSDVLEMDFDERDFRTHCLSQGDILLNEGQSRELVGRCAIYDGKLPECCFQNTLIRYRAGERVLTEYVFAFFQHCFHTGVFAAISSQTTSIAHLGADRFAKLRIPIPPKREQQKVAAAYAEIRNAELANAKHISRISELQSSIINAVTA
jgi:type I restriction enzyme S subunit